MKTLGIILLALTVASCTRDGGVEPAAADSGAFGIAATYDTIRSYAGGGGVFVLHITPGADFRGSVRLAAEGAAFLGASVSKQSLTAADTVAELLLAPNGAAVTGDHAVTVVASHAGRETRLPLTVSIRSWGAPDTASIIAQRDLFRVWAVMQRPDLAGAFDAPVAVFNTYPEILIVEHVTMLTEECEVRVCRHVMVPPYDWSMLRIRKRGCTAPCFAARRETDGSIHEITVAEYPELCGY